MDGCKLEHIELLKDNNGLELMNLYFGTNYIENKNQFTADRGSLTFICAENESKPLEITYLIKTLDS